MTSMTSRRRGAFMAVLVVVLAALWAWPREQVAQVAARAAPPGAAGWLRTEGGRIVDQEGRLVLLRGFDDDALLDYRNAEPGGIAPLDDTDAALMRGAGFDVVRLPLAWSLIEPTRGRLDQRYLERVRAAVSLLERHGLRVVLDMHVGIGWGPRSEVPAWAAVPAVPDLRWAPASPWKYSLTPRVAAAETYFWISPDWQRDLGLVWQNLARVFRDDPGVAGYDLFNEPHPLPIPPGIFESRYLWPFYARLITEISAVDARHLFIVEATLFGDFPTLVERLRGPNVVYSPHLYYGSLVSAPLMSDSPAAIQARVWERAGEAASVPAPLWVGEMGIDHDQPGAAAYTDATLGALDALGAGWAWWQWRQDGGWGIRSGDGNRLNLAALERIARPYLEAAPEGVAGAETAGGAALSIEVRSRHGDQPVLVGWPAITRGQPRVTGACLIGWTADGSDLELRLRPGAGCRIEVAAGG
jgi:endoglycosylceramidase